MNGKTRERKTRQVFSRQAFFDPKGSYEEFQCFKEVYERIWLPTLWIAFYQTLRPALNVQSDSTRVKVLN